MPQEDTESNLYIFRQDCLAMPKEEVQELQDTILMSQLNGTVTPIDISRTRYIPQRRAQVITVRGGDELGRLTSIVGGAIDNQVYSIYTPSCLSSDVFFTYIPERLRNIIERGFLIKLLLLGSTGFMGLKHPTMSDLEGHIKMASPPKQNLERVQLMYKLSPEYLRFLEAKKMKLTLASHSLHLKSADAAKIKAIKTAIENEISAA